MEKKYKIVYLPIAQQDLTEITEYIMLDNPEAAISLLDMFDESICVLEMFPLSRAVPNDGN